MVSGGRPEAERAWLTSARTWAAGLPGEVPAGLVADAAGEGDAGLADADQAGDDRGWRCLVRAAGGDSDGDGEGDAGALAWKGRPAQDPAGGAHVEGTCVVVTLLVADAGAGPEPRVR